MGAWYWSDVRYDTASATMAAEQLRRLATRLDDIGEALARKAASARVDWTGGARNRFDDVLEPQLRQCGDLVEALQRSAAHVDDSLDRAVTDQHHRHRLREAELRERAATADGRWIR